MRTPRLLPLVGVALGGVLAVKVLAGMETLPSFMQGAAAFAEGSVAAAKGAVGAKPTAAPSPAAAARPPAPVCAPTAAELAKEAGLSPAELQTLQSLGVRRGQLDERERGFETQIALMSAAEGKLDAKIAALNALRGDIRGLMGQADAQKSAEVDRLVTVYQAMKPRDAAARMTLLDDDVRLPIAAKMKERPLSAILAQMPPLEAKALTEKLAARFDPKLAAARAALAAQAQTAPQATAPAAAPAPKPAAAKSAPAPAAAKPTQVASADPLAPTPAAKPVRKPAAKPRPKPRRPAAPPATSAVADNAGPRPYNSLQPATGLTPAAKPAPARGNTSVPVPAAPAAKAG